MMPNLKVHLLLAVFIIIFEEVKCRKYGAGERCFPEEDWCDYSKWLWCRSGTCECLHPARQFYDVGRGRCVGLVGKECNVYIGERDCLSNAVCEFQNGKSRCMCKQGFAPSPRGDTCKGERSNKISSLDSFENLQPPKNIHSRNSDPVEINKQTQTTSNTPIANGTSKRAGGSAFSPFSFLVAFQEILARLLRI